MFLDECGLALNLHSFYGWGVGGGRLEENVPFNKGHNLSLVGAYSLPSENNPHPEGTRPVGAVAKAGGVDWHFVRAVLAGSSAALFAHRQRAGVGQRAHPSWSHVEGDRRGGGTLAVVSARLLPRLQPHRTRVELAQNPGARSGPAHRGTTTQAHAPRSGTPATPGRQKLVPQIRPTTIGTAIIGRPLGGGIGLQRIIYRELVCCLELRHGLTCVTGSSRLRPSSGTTGSCSLGFCFAASISLLISLGTA